MKYNCNVIKDLLPSYVDKICSDESRKIIEEHFNECQSCRDLSQQMKDNSIETNLNVEKNEILSKHNRHIKRKTYTIGIVTSVILMLPVVICLICNIAIGHALDWFFIVLTSMLLTASLIVVPLMAESKKLMWTVLCSTGSLILLLFTCCIYTHGDWFFIAASSCILGISLIFAPVILSNIKMNENVSKYRPLIVLGWDSIWLYILLIACGIHGHYNMEYWQLSLSLSTYIIIAILLCTVVIKYIKTSKIIKSGILTILIGLWIGLANNVINIFFPSGSYNGLEHLDLSKGFSTAITDNAVFNANIYFTVIVISLLVGISLIVIGYTTGHKKK